MYQFFRTCLHFSKISNCVVKKLMPASFDRLKYSCVRWYKEADRRKPIAEDAFSNASATKDVMLYQYENPRFFNRLKWVSLSQYLIWLFLGISGYNLAEVLPQDTEITNHEKWWIPFPVNERHMLRKLCILSALLGTGMIACIWFYMFRCVRRIVLKNNGKAVLFHTYSPLKIYQEFSVPIEKVSGVKNRKKVKTYLPLKLHKSPFYFLLDMNGEFKNPALFDITVALKRDFERKNDEKKGRPRI